MFKLPNWNLDSWKMKRNHYLRNNRNFNKYYTRPVQTNMTSFLTTFFWGHKIKSCARVSPFFLNSSEQKMTKILAQMKIIWRKWQIWTLSCKNPIECAWNFKNHGLTQIVHYSHFFNVHHYSNFATMFSPSISDPKNKSRLVVGLYKLLIVEL